MAHYLKFYAAEDKRHADLNNFFDDRDLAERVAFSLFRAYVAPMVRGTVGLKFRVSRRSKCAYAYHPKANDGKNYLVVIPTVASMLTIAHEIAHVWQYALTGKSKHDKMLAGLIDVLCFDLREKWVHKW
jgi:hypothetical protein